MREGTKAVVHRTTTAKRIQPLARILERFANDRTFRKVSSTREGFRRRARRVASLLADFVMTHLTISGFAESIKSKKETKSNFGEPAENPAGLKPRIICLHMYVYIAISLCMCVG